MSLSQSLHAISMLEHTIFFRYSCAINCIVFVTVVISERYTDLTEGFHTVWASKASLVLHSDINLLTATMEASQLGSSLLFPFVIQDSVASILDMGDPLTIYIL